MIMRTPSQIKKTFIVIWQVSVVAADECVFSYKCFSGLNWQVPVKWLSALKSYFYLITAAAYFGQEGN